MTSTPQRAAPPETIDGRATDDPSAQVTQGEARAVPGVVEAACHFAAARNRPAAVFLLAEGNPAEGTQDMPITRRTVSHMAAAVEDDPHFDDLDLVIQSSGGDIHAAYQMTSFLQDHMTGKGELVACVPRRAQSSATLLCLGGDRIALDEMGALGPLDAQIRVGLTEAGAPDYSSALHLIKGLNRLQEFSLDTLTQAAGTLYDNSIRRHDDIVRFAIEFSRGITAPLFERIESHKIGYWDQMLRTGEAYGRRLLTRGRLILDAQDVERDEHIDAVIRKLVFDYPSHEYVIDREELVERLHLRAELFTPAVTAAARQFAKYSSDTLVMLVYPPGATVPPAMADATASTLRHWKTATVPGESQVLSWESSPHGRFVFRVGLYRGPLKARRNPWREGTTPPSDGAPAEQYFAGDRPSWPG